MEEITSFDIQILEEIANQVSGNKIDRGVYRDKKSLIFIFRDGDYLLNPNIDAETEGDIIDILIKHNFDYSETRKSGWYVFSPPKKVLGSRVMEITKSDIQMLEEIARQVDGEYKEKRSTAVVDRVVLGHNILVAIDFGSLGEGKFYYINQTLDPEAVGAAINIFVERGLEYLKDVGAWYKFVNIEGV